MGFNEQAARGGTASCHLIAVLTTLFRLYHRRKIRRLWWDDFWALVSLVCVIPLMTTSLAWPIPTRRDPTLYILWRMSALVFYTTCLWSARLSVAVTLVRLLNPGPFRRVAQGMVVLFGVCCTALIFQKVFMCGARITPRRFAQCSIPRWTGPFELGTDIFADIWLIGAPVYMLFKLGLPRNHHRLILAIFMSSILTTGASAAHVAFILLKRPREIGTSGNIQAAISLLVCNLLVVVTYFYRVFRDEETSDPHVRTKTESARADIPINSLSPVGGVSNPETSILTFTEISTQNYTTSAGTPASPSSVDLSSSFFNASLASKSTNSRGQTSVNFSRHTRSAVSFAAASTGSDAHEMSTISNNTHSQLPVLSETGDRSDTSVPANTGLRVVPESAMSSDSDNFVVSAATQSFYVGPSLSGAEETTSVISQAGAEQSFSSAGDTTGAIAPEAVHGSQKT